MEAVPRTAEDIDAAWDFTRPEHSERRFRAWLDQGAFGDPDLRAEVATQLARALGLQGQYEDAHRVLDGVARVLPSTPSRLRARYLLERGRVLNSSGDSTAARPLFLEALRCFEEALRAREAQGDAALIRIVRWCVARGLRSLGRVQEALAIQRALLAEHERAGTEDREVYAELVACLVAVGRADEARAYEARLARGRVTPGWGSAGGAAAGDSP